MKIVVCVKQVPDLQSDRSMAGGRLVRGEDDVLNELDEYAVEAAVALAESLGGTVTAVTMGPSDADDALRRALQMGADDALHVADDALAGADVGVTATTQLVEHLRKLAMPALTLGIGLSASIARMTRSSSKTRMLGM